MDKKDIILILLASKRNPIVGTTKLQKLLFLAEMEKSITPDDNGFKFEPYKFGPASKELYNDLDFLANIGYITRSEDKENLNNLEIDNIEGYNANQFLSAINQSNVDDECSENENGESAKENDTKVYTITEEGIDYLKKNSLHQTKEYEKISEISKKYGNYSLTSLLQYVYRNYPNFTTESEIKNDIL